VPDLHPTGTGTRIDTDTDTDTAAVIGTTDLEGAR
jgi:hypothetical protein